MARPKAMSSYRYWLLCHQACEPSLGSSNGRELDGEGEEDVQANGARYLLTHSFLPSSGPKSKSLGAI